MPSPTWSTVPTSARSVSTAKSSMRCLRMVVISSGRSFTGAPYSKGGAPSEPGNSLLWKRERERPKLGSLPTTAGAQPQLLLQRLLSDADPNRVRVRGRAFLRLAREELRLLRREWRDGL